MEVFIANTQLSFPLFSCFIDCKSLNDKIRGTWSQSHGIESRCLAVVFGEAISFCRVWPWGVLFGFYLGLTLLLLTDTDIVRRSRVIHNKEDEKTWR